MGMVLDKTIEIIDAYKQQDYIDKCKQTFEKYGRFYKEEDQTEILNQLVGRSEVMKVFIETVDYRKDCEFYAELFSKVARAVCAKRIPNHMVQENVVALFDTVYAHVNGEPERFMGETLILSVRAGLVLPTIHILNTENAPSILSSVEPKLEKVITEFEQMHGKEVCEYEACDGEMFRLQVRVTDRVFSGLIKEFKTDGTVPATDSYFDQGKSGEYLPSEDHIIIRRQELGEYFLEHLDRYEDCLQDLVCEEQEWLSFYESDVSSGSLNRLAFTYNWDDGFVIPYMIIKHKNCDKGTALNCFSLADGFGCLEREMDGEIRPWDSEAVAFCHALLYRLSKDQYPEGEVMCTERFYSSERVADYKKMGVPEFFFDE